MLSSEGNSALLDVLGQYFSSSLARALLTSTLRRAKLDGGALGAHSLGEAVNALERALPMYLGDAGRRGECMTQLRKLAPVPATPGTTTSTVIQVRTADDVSNVCEVGRDIACQVGFPHVAQTKIATAIAELARNILLYAIAGEVRIAILEASRRGVEVTAVDQGPGITDLELVMSGQYRSRTGMGMGLRGAKRLMDEFDITSSPKGTRVLARKYIA